MDLERQLGQEGLRLQWAEVSLLLWGCSWLLIPPLTSLGV